MDPSTHTSRLALRLIYVFSGLLLGLLVLVSGLLFLLRIDETVDFSEGHIYSRTPQAVVHTPADVRVRQVRVREGDYVRRGDTLFVLENNHVAYGYQTTRAALDLSRRKLAVAERLLAYMRQRRLLLLQQRQLRQQTYQHDRTQNARELRAAYTALTYARQQAALSTERLRADSTLYTHQAVSRTELTDAQSRGLGKRKELLEARTQYEEKQAQQTSLWQTYQQQNATLAAELNSLEQELQRQERARLDLRTELVHQQNDAVVEEQEASELVVRAPTDGNVIDLYSTRQQSLLLARNQPLAVIAPRREQFYAKIVLPERELAYIRRGQAVNLKLNAYYHYQYGAVRGRVAFISPANVNDQFYTIVQLNDRPRFPLKEGYKLKGEIITTRYTLWRYAVKKLFDKLDTYDQA